MQGSSGVVDWNCPFCFKGTAMKQLTVPESGSLAGQTSSRNRFGQYRRTRAVPVNTNSTAQQTARNHLRDFSQAWRTLTGVQQESWTTWAMAHPRTDSLGQTIILTGFMAYVSVNSMLMNALLDAVDDPPTGDPPAMPGLGAQTLTAAGFSVAFTPTPVAAGGSLVIETSPPLSMGRQFNKDFRTVIVREAAAAATLLKAAMEAKWGTLQAGQRFFIRASVVDEAGNRSAFATDTVDVT